MPNDSMRQRDFFGGTAAIAAGALTTGLNSAGNPAITAPIAGLVTMAQVDNAAKAIAERRKLDHVEKAELEKASREMWAKLPPHYHWLRNWEHV